MVAIFEKLWILVRIWRNLRNSENIGPIYLAAVVTTGQGHHVGRKNPAMRRRHEPLSSSRWHPWDLCESRTSVWRLMKVGQGSGALWKSDKGLALDESRTRVWRLMKVGQGSGAL
jgi:hypothetical protein